MKVMTAPLVDKGQILVPEQKQLKDLKAGSGFRFYENNARTEDSVISSGEVYFVLDMPGEKNGIPVAMLDTGKVIIRDRETWVIAHEIDVHVHPSKKVPAPEPEKSE